MRTRGGILAGSLVVGAWLLFDCQPARANSVALSALTASNVKIADRGPGNTDFDPVFTTLALAHAQNSLGDADDEADSQASATAATSASVTWAGAESTSNPGTGIGAASNAHVPGVVDGASNSSGQALVFATFGISCPTCVGSTTVDFSVDLSGNLEVLTDIAGLLAQTETTFNMLVNGDTALFRNDLLSIGTSDFQVMSFDTTLTGSMTLDYGTSYDLVLRTDSESEVTNSPVPEPATVTLLCLGLGALGARRRRSSAKDVS
jgi:hypothetical protein